MAMDTDFGYGGRGRGGVIRLQRPVNAEGWVDCCCCSSGQCVCCSTADFSGFGPKWPIAAAAASPGEAENQSAASIARAANERPRLATPLQVADQLQKFE